MKYLLIAICCFLHIAAKAQYPPQAGVAGSTAISATSSLIVGWASTCELHRGYKCIDTPSLGYATIGDESSAIGPVDHDVVSLGDSGVAIIQFFSAIYNGPGPDFAVFENGFPNPSNPEEAFLELAFVEVSSDGVHYFRFPANSLTQDTTQIRVAGDYMDARKINNLAGKYISGYGTPFDLQELAGILNLNIDSVTHIRLVDVIGSIGNHASHDSADRKINDPYPTAIPGSGFDLDAVGGIHLRNAGVSNVTKNMAVDVYPNPATDKLIVSTKEKNVQLALTDVMGNIVLQQVIIAGTNELIVSQLPKGIYYLQLQANDNRWVEKITKL